MPCSATEWQAYIPVSGEISILILLILLHLGRREDTNSFRIHGTTRLEYLCTV